MRNQEFKEHAYRIIESVVGEDDGHDIELDNWDMVSIIMDIERELECLIDESNLDADQFTTIDQLAQYFTDNRTKN